MATSPVFIGTYKTELTHLVPANSTRYKRVWASGASGSRIHAISLSSLDAAANTIKLALGKALTLASNMGTTSFNSSTTITRSAGSFITDGWSVGERLKIFGATTESNNTEVILTTVAATTLTASAASFGTESIPSTAILYRLAQVATYNIAINAGYLPNVLPISLLDGSKLPAAFMGDDTLLSLGASDAIFLAPGTTLTGSELIDVAVHGGDF